MKNKKNRRKRRLKIIAIYMALNLFFNIAFPTITMALTSGPSSPEFSSFEPVATTDMVDPFTGNFTYNLPVLSIPGSDGGGYAMSLSYHSGANSEEEASWVGLGWTLNAGAINRQKNGLVDEFNGVTVHRYNQTQPNWSVSTTIDGAIEISSKDKGKKPLKGEGRPETPGEDGKFKGGFSMANPFGDLSMDAIEDLEVLKEVKGILKGTASVRYNNYQGFTRTNGYSTSFKGLPSLNMTRSSGESTFGLSVIPMLNLLSKQLLKIYSLAAIVRKVRDKVEEKMNKASSDGLGKKVIKGIARLLYKSINWNPGRSNINTFSGFSVARTIGRSINLSSSFQINSLGPIGLEIGFSGNMNYQVPIPQSDMLAYGYLHNPDWHDYATILGIVREDKSFNDGEGMLDRDSRIISDYNIERESSFNKHDNYLGIPFNSADQFMVSGEGAMGGFRLHHPTVGIYYPTPTVNKQLITQGGIEVGIGQTIQIGLDIGIGFQRTKIHNWRRRKSNLSGYKFSNPNYVFARFNNDRGGSLRYTKEDNIYSSYFLKSGKDLQILSNITRPGLEFNDRYSANVGRSSAIYYSYFDESGIIQAYDPSELDASLGGAFDKMEETVALRSTGGQPVDGIAEIQSYGASGERYIYGLPVYAKDEMSLTVHHTNEDGSPKADVAISGNVPHTIQMKVYTGDPLENYSVVGDEINELYATAYLLTQITTPNYIDVNNNGPDNLDYGGWTKFLYRKKYGRTTVDDVTIDDWYNHRAPYTGLYYNKGRINNSNDQTGSFSKGKKEVNYLKAVETKTHIAFFITNATTGDDFTDIADRLLLSEEEKTALTNKLNGSGEIRYDGMDAANEYGGSYDPAAQGEMGDRSLDKLERIVLFSKTRLEKALTTTYFKYSYDLCQGVPNSFTKKDGSPVFGVTSVSGKLTLDKVWTESEGIVRTKIAPYQFEYEYHRDYDDRVRAKYPEITDGFFDNDGDGIADIDLIEDPNYDVDLLDAWGNYMDADIAKEQRNKMRSWMNQRKNPKSFDPAAWSLKQIILPSGGEIHIQYEQKEYTHVQDKKAMTMVSLDPVIEHKNKMKYKENRYYINLADLQIDNVDSPEAYEYLKILAEHFFDAENPNDYNVAIEVEDDGSGTRKINLTDTGITPSANNGKAYFKFLYAYWGNQASIYYQGRAGKFLSEFIDGYVPINEIGKDALGIYLQFGGEKKNRFNIPRNLCRENLLTMGGNGLNRENKVWVNYDQISQEVHETAYFTEGSSISDDGNKVEEKEILKKIKKQIRSHAVATVQFQKGVMGFGIKNPRRKRKDLCLNLNPELSYIKLPTYKAKKGGGIRVKRLLTYDKGIKTGVANLYGTEYIYKMGDGTSSGVATYEPAGQRIENPMVDILDRHKQTLYNRLLSGRDKKHQEGPLGEQLYPGASVAHRRVVIRNIHTGKSAPGFVVNNYLTCKDYPSVTVEHTQIHPSDSKRVNKNSEHYKKSKINIPLGLFNYKKDNAWITQGYLFKIDDHHGKVKSTITYSGNIDPDNPGVTSSNFVLGSTKYTYSEMDDNQIGLSMDGRDFIKNPVYHVGEEEDITMYMGEVEDRTNDFNLEFDLNIWIQPVPLVTLGIMPNVNMIETQLSQHVTNTVMRRNSVVRKVESVVDGIKSTTTYLAYDENTGNPIITKTTDQYAGIHSRLKNDESSFKEHEYYSFNIPASWVYPELGQKARNFDNLNILSANAGSIVTYMSNPLHKFVLDEEDDRYKWNPYENPIQNVVEASAVELRKNRFDDDVPNLAEDKTFSMTEIIAEYDASSHVEDLNKFYYPVASYVYVDEVTSANADGGNAYEGGILNDFSFFKWKIDETDATIFSENIANNWKYVSEVSKFSPNAQPLEEVNILGISSAAKFGYGKLLPTIIAANAEYETIAFEDYESTSDFSTVDDAAHTGKRSIVLPYMSSIIVLKNLTLTNRLMEKGGYFKIWMSSRTAGIDENTAIPKISIIGGDEYNLKKVARVGEWTLYQVYITDWGVLTEGANLNLSLKYESFVDENVYLDDACFNPKEASVNCSVYDPTSFRLLAQFGDQHFATIYEYNAEGQLVRTVIETERGRKTIQEQGHNSNRIDRE